MVLNFHLKLSDLEPDFTLSLDYLNLALNNSTRKRIWKPPLTEILCNKKA